MQASSIEPIHKQRLAPRVAGALRRLIVDQGLDAGQRLPTERDLASALAVSRHVVREALRLLELEGIIVSNHGNGTFVRRRPELEDLGPAGDQDSLAVKLEARSVFEAGLAELIVERATDEDVDGLLRIMEDMKAQVALGRPAGMQDVLFHEQLLRCAHNATLARVGHALSVDYLRDRLIGDGAELVYAPEGVDLGPHEVIVAAIQRRDVNVLRQSLRVHGSVTSNDS